MRLWLVRHAVPLIDAGTCYGALDVAADADATQVAARQLADALPHGTVVFTSPRQRCGQLAQALHALRPDLPPATDTRLAEMDFGQWEGLRWDAIDRASVQAWTDDFAGHAPGNGETVRAFMARVAGAFDALPRAQAGDTAWITHAGVIRAACLLHAGVREVTDARQWPSTTPGFGTWSVRVISWAAVRA